MDANAIELGRYAVLDDELVVVTAVTATQITVGRDVVDTVPAPHLAGTRLLFIDDYISTDGQEYDDGETTNIKLLPTTGKGTLAEAAAPFNTVTFDGRAAKPYPRVTSRSMVRLIHPLPAARRT